MNYSTLQLVCQVDELQIGDKIWTPAHLWETVTMIDCGDTFTHSTRVATEETGPDHPREWANSHKLMVQRDISLVAVVVPQQKTPADMDSFVLAGDVR